MEKRNSARAIIVEDGKMAVIHRRKNGVEYYTTPGGGVDEGENLEEALKREIMEELGQEVTDYEFAFMEEWDGKLWYYYWCRITGGELVLNGPEKNPVGDNWYNPEWIEINDEAKTEKLRPEKLKEYVKRGKVW